MSTYCNRSERFSAICVVNDDHDDQRTNLIKLTSMKAIPPKVSKKILSLRKYWSGTTLFNYRLPDPLGLPPPRLHPHDSLLHHPQIQHQLPEGMSRISEGSRLSDGGISRLSDSLSEAHSPPLMATNLSVTGPLRVAVPSPHTPSSRGSPTASQQTPQGQSQGQGLIRVATPPPLNPKPPQIHRPFSPAWYDELGNVISRANEQDRSIVSRKIVANDESQFLDKRFEILWKE